MKVAVRFFASLREAVGRECMAVDVEPPTVDALRDSLARRLSPAAQAALTAPGVRVAVNRAIAHGAASLDVGDEVAFLPPVTGG